MADRARSPGLPTTVTKPSVGLISPVITRILVDFPAPSDPPEP